MNIINWVHIIDDSGKNFFSLENQEPGSESVSSTVLSHLIYALQAIAKDLDFNEIKSVEMGSNRFFLCKEQKTNYLFILKTNRDADARVISPALQKIIDKFPERFTGYNPYNIKDSNERKNSFSEDVKQIINSISDD